MVGTSEGGGRDRMGGSEEEKVTGEGEEDMRGGRKGKGKYIGEEKGKGRGGKSRPHGHF